MIPPKFRFIDHTVLGKGVEAAAANFRSGCVCANEQECMYSGCHCLEEMASSDEDEDEDDSAGPSRSNRYRYRRKKFAYHSRGAKAGMLRSRVLESREPIYECHPGCACSIDCPNRVVERGRKVPLQIFRTDDRGWGEIPSVLTGRDISSPLKNLH